HVALEPPRLLRRHDAGAVEVLHLGRDAHGKLARVERANPVDPAATRDGSVPRRRRVVAERRDGAETRDDDPAHRGSLIAYARWEGFTRNQPGIDEEAPPDPGSFQLRRYCVTTAAVTPRPVLQPQLVFFHSSLSGACRRAEGFLAQVLQRRRNHE